MTSQPVNNLKSFLVAFKHHKAGRLREAETVCRQILQADPENAHANNLLGLMALQAGRYEIAMQLITAAIQQNPHEAFFYNSLGNVLKEQGKFDGAVKAFKEAVQINSHYADAYNNLGNVLKEQGRLDEGLAAFEKAVQLNPGYAEAHSNLGGALKSAGKFEEAIASYRTALAIDPSFTEVHSNLVYGLLSLPAITAEDIYREAKRWEQQHAAPLYANQRHHENDKEKFRRLKIGYVSPDFRSHSVNVFFEPFLKASNKDRFETYLYANVKHPDEASKRLEAVADHWLSIVGMGDEQVAKRIRQDGIDILVDLAKHTAGNRLLVFAHKPAPVQATWSGCPATTGMEAIDYRLVDDMTHPIGAEDDLNSEELIRLEHGYFCFEPLPDAPEVKASPVKETGRVTFGSFNSLHKVNRGVIALWSEIFNRVNGSHLLFVGKPFAQQSTIKYFLDMFAEYGVDTEKIELIPRLPFQDYLALYNRVDIALDPFPYNGHTTTIDGLRMGVPLITLQSGLSCSRVGGSILTRIGLSELIAENKQEYVEKAVQLAEDTDRLSRLRAGMRDRVLDSSLCDVKSFTQSVEGAFTMMWARYVES